MATKKRDSRIIEEMLETARGLQGAGLITASHGREEAERPVSETSQLEKRPIVGLKKIDKTQSY